MWYGSQHRAKVTTTITIIFTTLTRQFQFKKQPMKMLTGNRLYVFWPLTAKCFKPFNLSLGCYLVVVVVRRLARNVATPQCSTNQAVGHEHHQQGERVDQQNDCILITGREVKGRCGHSSVVELLQKRCVDRLLTMQHTENNRTHLAGTKTTLLIQLVSPTNCPDKWMAASSTWIPLFNGYLIMCPHLSWWVPP